MIPPWPVVQLFFSGALQKLLKGLSVAAKWLVADWRNGPLVVCALMWAAHALLVAPKLRGDLVATRADLTAERAAHIATVENYIAAGKRAKRQAEANAARVKAEQERITDATLATYRADLAALRDRFERLRNDRLRARNASAVDPRHPDPSGLPAARDAAGRAVEAPGEDRLPAPGLSLSDALIASEQALQLGALIDWIEAQSAVRFTPEEPRR